MKEWIKRFFRRVHEAKGTHRWNCVRTLRVKGSERTMTTALGHEFTCAKYECLAKCWCGAVETKWKVAGMVGPIIVIMECAEEEP